MRRSSAVAVAQQRGRVVGSADSFFCHVEDSGAPQIAGGIAVLRPAPHGAPPLSEVRDLVERELPHLPGFESRLVRESRWRRPRWVDARPDPGFHVTEREVDGVHGLEDLVAELAALALPRDRPLWRIVMARDTARQRSAMVFMMHHALGDGVGTVTDSLQLMRPRTALPDPGPGPGRWARAGATALGLGQLAVGGLPGRGLGETSPGRAFATVRPSLDAVRAAAGRRGLRMTDLLLALLGDAVAATCPRLAGQRHGELRVAVSRLVARPPEAGTTSSNATGAVMVEVPVDGRPLDAQLAEVGRRAHVLRRPTRAVASRFVMTGGLRALPEPAVGWFAGKVYGRRFFQGILTNFPGPTRQLHIGGVPIEAVYPILPLAPGAPIAMGSLSWHGVLGVSLAADPAWADPRALLAHLEHRLAELAPG